MKDTLTIEPLLNITFNDALNAREAEHAYSGPDFEGLVESIRENGILAPLLVRPTADEPFELVCGYRRFRAACSAGLVEVPVLVRDFTDEEAVTARIVENLQREDVHPLDESAAIEQLRLTMSMEEVANKIGKSPSYTAKHASLAGLEEILAGWFRENRMGLTDAIELARLPLEAQKTIAKEIRKNQGRNPDHINPFWLVKKHHLSLGDAVFDTGDDALVPEAGSCKFCPKRTGNQHALFDDVKERDTCTDVLCFRAKVGAHWTIYSKEIKAAGGTVLTKTQAKDMFPQYGAGIADRTLIDYDADQLFGDGTVSPEELIPELSPKDLVVALDRAGSIRRLIPKKLVTKALRAAQPKPKKGEAFTYIGVTQATRERRARRLANAQNREIHRRTVEVLAAGFKGRDFDLNDAMVKSLWFLTVLHAKAHRNIIELIAENERDYDKFKLGKDESGFLVDEEKIILSLLPTSWTLGDLLGLHLKIAQQTSVKDPSYRLEPDPNVLWAAAFAGVDVATCKEDVAKRLAPKARAKKNPAAKKK